MANGNFAGGDGSKESPFLIEDAHDLNAIRNMGDGKYYKLINDIDMDIKPYNEGDGWNSIDNFGGIIDGNGNTIKNLIQYDVSKYEQDNTFGLFGKTRSKVIIKNLKLYNFTIVNNDRTNHTCGLLIGSCASGSNVDISNIVINSCIINIKSTNTGFVAGYFNYNAKMNNIIIKNCKNESIDNVGLITGTNSSVANHTGKINNVVVYNSIFKNVNKLSQSSNIDNIYIESDINFNDANMFNKTSNPMNKFDFSNSSIDNENWIIKLGEYPRLWFETDPNLYLFQCGDKIFKPTDDDIVNLNINRNELNEDIFENNGVEDFGLFYGKQNIVEDKMKKTDIDGIFEYDINNEVGNIDEIINIKVNN